MSPASPRGLGVPPRWWITPLIPSPTLDLDLALDLAPAPPLTLVLLPGPGFGDGTHPTTHLCLQALAALAPRAAPWSMLDFGSGSGVLSLGAARLGATVSAVEIDAAAIAHAEHNACATGVADRIRHSRTLDAAPGPFDLVVANILRAVLLDHAGALVARLAPGATLVLSGLISTDVPEVSAAYARQLDGQRPEVYERGEWRALVWRRTQSRPEGG